MKNTSLLSLLFLIFFSTHSVFSQFISEPVEVKIDKPFQESSQFSKYRYDSISYEQARAQKDYVFETFTYNSDGLEVTGWLCRKKSLLGQPTPAIIYNRGGTGNIGRLSAEDLPDFYYLAKDGFTVFASDYRFVDERAQFDEIGGSDINDVVNLYQLVSSLDYVDSKNIFMMGVSRGGLMTYKSLTKIDVNAAAVFGGVADYEDLTNRRPIFLTGWSDLDEELNYKGLANVLPSFEENKEQYMAERSASAFAEEIHSPIYILHSRQDGRVPVTGALNLIAKLYELEKEFKVKIYDKKSHSLPYSKFDSFDETIEWFKNHMKN